jgi:hypothetical protein
MIEVFKTNVMDQNQADMLLGHIQTSFHDYKANFDLEDCDKILRVACTTGPIECAFLINLLKNFGFDAEVLPDEDQVL